MGRALLLGLSMVAACARQSSVACDDGRTCPQDTFCENDLHICLTVQQKNVCADQSIRDGFPCTADDKPGICSNQLCLPGCGDGVTNSDLGEECDDGNFASHDGCSSRCLDETPQWTRIPDAWHGSVAHALELFPPADKIVLVTGNTDDGPRSDQWERVASGTSPEAAGWSRSTQTPPPSRLFASMVFDSQRGKLVLFGGIEGVDLNDTWEYDGTTWEKKAPVTAPPARHSATMVFDQTANTVIVFGGLAGDTALADTWEYNGTTWTNVTPATSPGPRFEASMAWDTSRARAVLFGGITAGPPPVLYGDTWEYAAHAWTPITTGTAPDSRFGGTLAYYPPRISPARGGQIILFGGLVGTLQTASDTWRYTSAGWSRVSGAEAPSNRYEARMAYSRALDALVLVGGAAGTTGQPLDDVWEFKDGFWLEHTPHLEPSARFAAPAVYDEAHAELHIVSGLGSGIVDDAWAMDLSGWLSLSQLTGRPVSYAHSMAYDPKRGVIVVFGGAALGSNGSLADVDDTYEYEEVNSIRNWIPRTFTIRPPPRAYGSLAYDGSELVLFGGGNGTTVLGDTWEYDGTAWTPASSTGPSISPAPAAAYDPLGKRMILFDQLGATYAYANHAWSLIAAPSPPTTPPARSYAMMTFDTQRRRITLIGGGDANADFTDVWELDGSTWSKLDVPPGGPLPRVSAGWASHAWLRESILVGGGGPAGTFGDTWAFRFQSTTPEEVCDSRNSDDDGDGHVDDDDPDCCARHQPPNCGF